MKLKLLSLIAFVGLSNQVIAQEWSPIADMPSGKHHPVTFAIDGFGYSATGSDPINGASKDFYRYDPTQDSWTTLPDFPGAARSFAIGYEYEGLGYLGFGMTNIGGFLKDIYTYNPSIEEWNLLTICPCIARRHPAFLIVNDKIFVGLGNDQFFNDLNDWWMYDMVADEWTQLPDLPALERHHPFHFVVGGELYTGLGHGGPIVYDDWYKFDQTTQDWVTLNDFPGEARVAGSQFNHGDYGYVLSGDGSNHSFMEEGEFWQYDPQVDDWTQMPSHPGISLWAPGSFVIDDTVYFFGGESRQSFEIQSDAYKFSFAEPTPPQGSASVHSTDVFLLWPNPTSNELNIKADFEISQVSILSLAGQLVYSEAFSNNSISVSQLSSGIYIMQLTSITGDTHSARWVKD